MSEPRLHAARPRAFSLAPAYPRLAITLGTVALTGCPVFENGFIQSSGDPAFPYDAAEPSYDAPLVPPDAIAFDAPSEATTDAGDAEAASIGADGSAEADVVDADEAGTDSGVGGTGDAPSGD